MMIIIKEARGQSTYLDPFEITDFQDVRGMTTSTVYVTMKNGSKYKFEMSAAEFAKLREDAMMPSHTTNHLGHLR